MTSCLSLADAPGGTREHRGGSEAGTLRPPMAVCARYEREVRAILASEGLEGNHEIRLMGAGSGQPCPGWPAVPHGTRREPSGSCEACLGSIAPDWLVDSLKREGAMPVSPGWLADWEARSAAAVRPRDGGAASGADRIASVCLLDTGVLEGSQARLEACGEAMGAPVQRIPVGLEHCRRLLARRAGQGEEDELRRGRDELLGRLAQRDRVLTLVGHDLRGPLGSMHELLGRLIESTRGSLGDEDSEILAEMHATSGRISAMIHGLFDWGKTRAGAREPRLEAVDAREAASHALGLHASQAAAKKIMLSNEVEPGFSVMADPQLLQAVLRNLVSNAIKFTPRGGAVRVRGFELPSARRLDIRDTGIGLDQTALERLNAGEIGFSRAGTEGERGSGLGMLICRDFVAGNGGRLEFASAPGGGTTVSIVFPDGTVA